ncbi:MAG TPA: AAA family ATPase, partial [Gammaproteobacteria bacterium]|nr:AAA family ATPase [Gammaproteobacteria bacterium]
MFNNHSSHISDYVGVRPHPTVVRLENLSSAEADWLTESFVLTDAVRGHLAALKSLLESGRGGGAFLIGHYGAGKSHFLGYLARELEAGRMLTPAPAVCVVSLVNFSAANRLEDVISDALGLDRQGGDRREVWSALARRYPQGVFLLLDELSEFLRSQSEVSRFNEDIRFLQFLGEWAQNQRFWILAAMQEGIEHTGELEYSLYRKIKDRYPLRLLLSPTHVKTLIADGILIKQPGYEEAVNGLVADWRERMPGVELDYALLPAIYPLHPATLTLLEEVRDRFSQTRGVVDFVVTQLRGDASRGVEPFLQQPWGALISPDVIIDHFRDLFEIQPEYLTLAQQVFPWYEKALPELFPKPVLRQLAERLLKLLALVYLSPARERLTVREAVAWLAFSAARVEPERNLRVVEKTLDTLAERGRYVTADRGGYRLKPRDDAAQALARHLKREMSELVGRDDLVLETLTGLLGEADFNPFRLPRERWLNRQVSWCFHPRAYAVWFGAASPGQQPDAKMAFCLGLPWGPSQPVAGHYTLMPGRIVMREEFTELAALMRLRERPLAPEAAARVDKRIADGKIGFASALQNAWLQARLVGPTGTAETPPRLDARRGLDAWLDAIALLLLKRTYPGFERFAPGYGPLPKEAWRRFMRLSLDDDPMALEADEYARLIREAYLAPMGLLRRRGRDYVVRANLDRHELVAQVMPLAENGVSPKTLYQHLAEPIYGLVEEQVTALLVFLCLQGEIELTKGAHSYRNHFETLPNPIAYDRLSIGQSLDPGQLAALARLCEYFSLKLARDAGAIAQRQAISAVSQRAREQAEALEKFVLPLRQEGLGRRLAEQAQQQIDAWRLLGQGDQGMNALALFLYQVSGVDGFLERDRLLTRQAKRLPGLLAELKRLQHLIHHPMLDAPATKTFRSQLKRLEEPPPLEQTDELADWLARAAEHYADYQKDYARRHRDW